MISTNTSVASIMSSNVLVAHIDYNFTEISRLFLQMDIHHLPILGANERLIGVISSNDVLKAYNQHITSLKATDEKTLNETFSLFELMTSNPISIAPGTTVGEAAKNFTENNIHCLPVVEGGKVVGIVTTRDIVRYCSEEPGGLS